ncbi:MAG: cytochrome C oxidase subunit IV family protein [Phycisphaera sp.]|nr:MAG: cytochrome C oxidase subunit IV family protein [Phycisphaera sp.]
MSSDAQHETPRPDPSQMTEAEYQDYMADPHSFHPDHHGPGEHGHDGDTPHVVSLFLLRAVLGVLVFFTILTVASSRGEIWLADTFELEIPTLVNVFIAMSIASIKAIFVVAIFMHLKWDNRLNMMVFLFTLMGVGLFIGLTAMDLGNRDELYDWKGAQIEAGGLGGLTRGEDTNISTSMVEYARTQKILEIGEAEYEYQAAKKHPHHGHHEPLRSPDRSRAAHGLTAGLFSVEAPHDDHAQEGGHEEGHDDGAEHADSGEEH